MNDVNKGTGINWGRVFALQGNRNEHGAVNLAAMLTSLKTEAEGWITKNEITTERVAQSVAVVMEQARIAKVKLDLNELTSRTLTDLKAPMGSETRLGNRVKHYMRGESESFEKGGTGKYHIKRGKDGGVILVSPQYAESFRKLQAKKAVPVQAAPAPVAAPAAAVANPAQ